MSVRWLSVGLAHSPHSAESLLDVLRPVGIKAERAMLVATGGVNTQGHDFWGWASMWYDWMVKR
ncbi:triphosphoribosyl-dephospho-CoA synthase CitG [Vibrio spartinae]|uniref:Triphosphoribosyl-dephospho-CoA synthase CitG n=1 Tax=Vibrio spartinae TaxID=1918945 RepID=A0A1N6MB57_9VIBR|nr:triphosphoribosyl-dephospho-CoA synthase CitG [Vibrio spartinae]SIO96580.1 hypothetical protein VSP9026_04383 [Vibrio spartinae]